MFKNKTLILFLVLLLTSSLTLTGCSFEDEATDMSEKTIRVGRDRIGNLDPDNTMSTHTIANYMLIGDPLIKFNEAMMQFVPAIASDWVIKDNNMAYAFEIRDDVYFHNGNRLTVEDVKFTFERLVDPEEPSQSTDLFMLVEGAQEKMAGEADEISGIEIVDDNKIKFTLVEPRADFLGIMAIPTHAVVNKDEVLEMGEDYGAKGEPLTATTGVFKYGGTDVISSEDEEDERLSLRFVKNENYFGDKPNLDKVFLEQYDEETVTDKFLDGYYDNIITMERIPGLESYKNAFSLGGTHYITFNTQKDLWQNENMRKAIKYAIDEKEFVEITGMETAKGFLSPELPGTEPIEEDVYDLELAEQYLEEAGYPNGEGLPALELHSKSRSPVYQEAFRLIIDHLSEIGIEMEITTSGVEGEELFYVPDSADFMEIPWNPDYIDLSTMFELTLTEGSPFNFFGLSHDRMNQLLQDAQKEPNQHTRIEMYNKVNQIIHDETLLIPIGYDASFSYESDRLTSIRHALYETLRYEKIDVR